MQQVQELLGQATVSAGEIEQLLNQGPITVDQLSLLLSRGNFTPQQSRLLLALAGLTDAQLAQVQSRLQGQAGAAVDAAMIQLKPFLDQLSLSEAQLTRILAQLGTTPAQFNDVLQQLSILPAAAGALMKRIEATPAQLEQLAADIRAEAVKAEPPLGTRPSRVIRLAGDWVSVPLRLAGDWLYFALVLLLVTKLLGGRAPLPKHLGAMALAAAPLVLLIGLYSPDLNGVLTLAMAGAVHYYARVLALIGLVWGSLLLLRALSLAHEISPVRTAAALALTWVTIYVLIPLAGILITGYLVTG